MADETPDDPPSNSKDEEKPEKPNPEKEGSTPEGKDLNSGPCISRSPSGEELSEGEIDKIVTSTYDLLQFCKIKVDQQKLCAQSLAFMLLRVQESLDSYHNDFFPRMNTFLANAEGITADYYARICCVLPEYGDYLQAIDAEKSEKIKVRGDEYVNKNRLVSVVQNVTDNYYTVALLLQSGRTLLKDVNSVMNDRINIVCQVISPIPNWMKIQDSITFQLECIINEIFKITAFLNFLGLGRENRDEKVNKEQPVIQSKTIKREPSETVKKEEVKLKDEPQKIVEKEEAKPKEEPQNIVEKEEVKIPEPVASTDRTEEPSALITPENQEKINEEGKIGAPPTETEEESEDDIFNPKGRIRKYKKPTD